MNTIIEINNLVKKFKHNKVINGLSMKADRGSVIGLLGSNGAGKTTFIQTLIGLMRADEGECYLFGEKTPELSAKTKHRIGYVPQEAELISWMKVHQMIEYTKSFYQHWNDQLVEELLIDWSLGGDQVISKLSVGQKQKLAIILALGHEPELLILDEPVASLDPLSRRKFIKQLIDLNLDDERTILFSTHITSDLERVAAQVLIMRDGENYYQGDIDELKERVARLHIESSNELPANLNIENSISVQHFGKRALIVVEDLHTLDIEEIKEALNASVHIESLNLEDIFVELHA